MEYIIYLPKLKVRLLIFINFEYIAFFFKGRKKQIHHHGKADRAIGNKNHGLKTFKNYQKRSWKKDGISKLKSYLSPRFILFYILTFSLKLAKSKT